jgi:peptidoglycan/xylan/chitin deacetylase (PgdA/CDA1 family)
VSAVVGAFVVEMIMRAPAPPAAIVLAPPADAPAAGPPSRAEEDTAWTAPTPASLVGQPIITRIDNARGRIAITFDACATKTHGYGFDRAVYDILQREKVPATIFTSGRWVEFHPDVMSELKGDPLIEFGNHSYDHPHMSRLDTAHISAQIQQTEAALGRYGKRSVAFRPPFGDIDTHVVDVVHRRGLPVVTWDVVSGDPSAATTTRGMIDEVDAKTRPGSIVIFHINGRGWKTALALPTILQDLRARGFEFVHLSALLAWRARRADGTGGADARPGVASSVGGAGGTSAPGGAGGRGGSGDGGAGGEGGGAARGGAGESGGRTPVPTRSLPGAAMCEPPASWDRIEPTSSSGEETRSP